MNPQGYLIYIMGTIHRGVLATADWLSAENGLNGDLVTRSGSYKN